jgi:hypothetical protein
MCPICRRAPAVHVDHDHVTLAIRGVLCADCNTGMGQMRDNSWVLRRAIEYLTGGLYGLRPVGDDLALLNALARATPVSRGRPMVA